MVKGNRPLDPLQYWVDENTPKGMRDFIRSIELAAKPSKLGRQLAELDRAAREGKLEALAAKLSPDHPLAQMFARYAEAFPEEAATEEVHETEEPPMSRLLTNKQIFATRAELEHAIEQDPTLLNGKLAIDHVAERLPVRVSGSTIRRLVVNWVFKRKGLL
jgi:rRNA maturation endonuclease Nob1